MEEKDKTKTENKATQKSKKSTATKSTSKTTKKATGTKSTGTAAKKKAATTKSTQSKAKTDTTAKDVSAKKEQVEQEFWQEAKENVSEGAKVLADEAKTIGQKIGSYSEKVFGIVKEKTSDALQSGLDLTSEGVNKAQEIAENWRDKYEIRKLNDEKKKVAAQLGIKFYLALKNNNNQVPDGLVEDKVFFKVLKELEDIDKEIIKLSEEE